MCLDSFYPHDKMGLMIERISSFTEALPIISFFLSVFASSLGMTKFYVSGPLRLILQASPISAAISFFALLFINCSFIFRIFAIEHSLFSHYIMSSTADSYEKWGVTAKEIQPVLSHKYRLMFYLIPIIPSMLFNTYSFHKCLNYTTMFKVFLHFPQYFITSCFTPIIFKGIIQSENNRCQFKIKLHKKATIWNSIYIIFVPQLMLVISEVWRDVINWEFTTSLDKASDSAVNAYLETNTSITKHPFGNILFAIVISILNLMALLFLFLKHEHLFSRESDIIGSKSYDEENWKIFWIRNQYTNSDSRESQKVIKQCIYIIISLCLIFLHNSIF